MQFNKNNIFGFVFAIVTTVFVSVLNAAPNEITLPPETAKFRYSSLPGYAIASQKCILCHSPDYISFQPPAMSLEQWTSEVYKMQHKYGAPISGTDIRIIGSYLAVAYGTAKKTDEKVIAASTAAKLIPGTKLDATEEVRQLLYRNACFACHAIDKEIVGPAFQEISAKYRADNDGQEKISHSIRVGSTGKWGDMTMPSMNKLTELEAKALASFILKQ